MGTVKGAGSGTLPVMTRDPAVLGAKIAVHRLRRYLAWARWRRAFALERVAAWRPGGREPHLAFAHRSALIRDPARAAEQLQHEKVHNLRIAVARLDGLLLRPGEMFSFCRLVGPTTRRRGYLPALELRRDGLVARTGGGLCQLSNIIHWLALHLDLPVVERHRHELDLFPDRDRQVPFGCGASVFYNYNDLRFVNPGPRALWFRFRVEPAGLVGEVYADAPLDFRVEVYDVEGRMYRSGGQVWRENRVRRRVVRCAEVRDEEIMHNVCRVLYPVPISGGSGRNNHGGWNVYEGEEG